MKIPETTLRGFLILIKCGILAPNPDPDNMISDVGLESGESKRIGKNCFTWPYGGITSKDMEASSAEAKVLGNVKHLHWLVQATRLRLVILI
jgi:hypothetical protein